MDDLHKLLGVPKNCPPVPPECFIAEAPEMIERLLIEGHQTIRITMGRGHAELLMRLLRERVLPPNLASDDRRATSGGPAGNGRARGSGRRPKP